MDIAHFVFGIFGNAFGLFLFLAPLITFKRIIVKKSTEKFSGVPYIMTLLNCLLSSWYGLPFVSPHNILVAIINGTGAVIEIIYVLIFILYAPKKEKLKISGLFVFVITVFSAVVFISLFALHGNSRKLFCGFATAYPTKPGTSSVAVGSITGFEDIPHFYPRSAAKSILIHIETEQ